MRFEVSTSRREDLVDVTARVAEIVAAAGVENGIVVVSSPHTTAGVTVNENADPDVIRDVLHGLERIFPRDGGWRHFEGNSDAHLKTAVVGTNAMLPVAGGRLALGTWQAICLAEFDGPRARQLDVVVVPGVS
jgi:secondary thiamine-phosphate synthase enzyme